MHPCACVPTLISTADMGVPTEKMELCDKLLEGCEGKSGGLGVQGFCWGAKCATLLAGMP